jgi:hypothetical protein
VWALAELPLALDMYQSKVQLKLERMIDTLLATVLVPMGN